MNLDLTIQMFFIDQICSLFGGSEAGHLPYAHEFLCYPCSASANWGQIIAINLFTPPIIGYYWLLLAIIAIIGLQKVLLLLAIIGLHPKH